MISSSPSCSRRWGCDPVLAHHPGPGRLRHRHRLEGLPGMGAAVTIGSLFSGIGGLELGLEACGLGPVIWQCDSDPAARAVLEAHWPGVRRYNDVREIDGRAERPDLICGGFPCQPVSLAGKRKAQKDTRWLWPFFAAVVDRLRPRVVFIENVPGLRTAGLRDVLGDLAHLGFDAEWGYFSACETGAPHTRLRLFILAHARSIGKRGTDVEGSSKLLDSEEAWATPLSGSRWSPSPEIPRVDDGLPGWAHRIRLLGNACVPAQAALAFRELARRAAA